MVRQSETWNKINLFNVDVIFSTSFKQRDAWLCCEFLCVLTQYHLPFGVVVFVANCNTQQLQEITQTQARIHTCFAFVITCTNAACLLQVPGPNLWKFMYDVGTFSPSLPFLPLCAFPSPSPPFLPPFPSLPFSPSFPSPLLSSRTPYIQLLLSIMSSKTAVKQEWYKGFHSQKHPYTIPVWLLPQCEHPSLPSASASIRKTGRFTLKMQKLAIIVQARNSRFAGAFFWLCRHERALN